MKRRIRVANCPCCNSKTPLTRKYVEDGEIINVSICHNCFCAFDNYRVESYLEERADHDNH